MVSGNASAGSNAIVLAGSSSLTLVNTTVNNNPGTGGNWPEALEVGVGSTATLKNSIVANPSPSANCLAQPGGIVSQGGNLSSDHTCASFLAAPGDQNDVDPLLGPLQVNAPGTTATQALLPGSPAIDAVPLPNCPPPTTDQRGVSRPQGVRCDSGAYEAPPVPTLTPTITPTPNPCTLPGRVSVQAVPNGDGRLRVTVTETAPGKSLQSLSFVPDGHTVGNGLIDTATQTGLGLPLTLTPPAGTTSYTFWLRPATPGQGATVPFTVQDSCGSWPTFVGGGSAVFSGGASPPAAPAPPAPSATPGPSSSGPRPAGRTPTSTPTAAPTPAPVCAPRPTIAVATAPDGAGRLRVTLTAPASANDRLLALRFGAALPARIDAGGQSGPGSFSVSLPPGTQQTSFTVTRVTAGQTVTVALTVVDSCGEWPTVVGGGPSAF
jgi:hypothetical protein